MTDTPIQTYRFTLTAADALVWEARPRELGNLAKLAYLLPVVLGGVGIGLMPPEWTEGWRFFVVGGVFVVLVYGSWTLGFNLLARQRARRRYPVPTEVVVEDWLDHLAIVENGRKRFIASEAIANVMREKDHMIIVTGDDQVIMPRSAFEKGRYEPFAKRLVLRAKGLGEL